MTARTLALTSISLLMAAPVARADSAAVVALRTEAAIARGDAPAWFAPELPEEVERDVQRKGRRLAESLDLGDDAKADAVAALVAEHFGRVWAWHQEVDADLDAAWDAWDEARNNTGGKEKDELRALAVATERLDPIYAEFAPQIERFVTALESQVGEEKALELIDRVTRSPGAKRTYNAYCEMVPEMTDSEKAILWARMDQARRESLAAWTDGRIIKLFKKQKVRCEFSLDYFGYGYRERYSAWIKANSK